jgi:hypothetical protein
VDPDAFQQTRRSRKQQRSEPEQTLRDVEGSGEPDHVRHSEYQEDDVPAAMPGMRAPVCAMGNAPERIVETCSGECRCLDERTFATRAHCRAYLAAPMQRLNTRRGK